MTLLKVFIDLSYYVSENLRVRALATPVALVFGIRSYLFIDNAVFLRINDIFQVFCPGAACNEWEENLSPAGQLLRKAAL
jgi:hypothetical protein